MRGENGTGSRRKTLMELLLICLPFIHSFCLLYPALYFLSLDIPFLLISVVPPPSRNVWTILVCLTSESLSMYVLLAWGIYLLFMVVSFILTFNDIVDQTIRGISR